MDRQGLLATTYTGSQQKVTYRQHGIHAMGENGSINSLQ